MEVIFATCVLLSTLVYLFETYVDYRQHLKLKETKKPAKLVYVDNKEFLDSQAYGLDKSSFHFISSAFDQAVQLLILFYGGYPWLWSYSEKVLQKFGLNSDYEVTQSLIFVFFMVLFYTIVGIPFGLYKTFVVEERHGFNKQTYRLYFTDMIKSLALGVAIGAPIVAVVLHVINWGGDHFYFYIWVVMLIIQLLLVTIYPTIIQPLFNKVEPLEQGPLKAAIEKLASSVGFPLKKLYVIDGSKRSSHSNAYMYGFCNNKRIVLFDTLLPPKPQPQSNTGSEVDENNNAVDNSNIKKEHEEYGTTNEEIIAILGHELGHWKLSHTLKMLALSQIHLFGIFFLFGLIHHNKRFFHEFGFSTQPTLIGLLLFSLIIRPLDSVLQFLMHLISRHSEFQADEFAKGLGYANELVTGLIKTQKKNKGTLVPDPLYCAYNYSHPPLLERLNAIQQKDKSK